MFLSNRLIFNSLINPAFFDKPSVKALNSSVPGSLAISSDDEFADEWSIFDEDALNSLVPEHSTSSSAW